jgi:hypothetical protein
MSHHSIEDTENKLMKKENPPAGERSWSATPPRSQGHWRRSGPTTSPTRRWNSRWIFLDASRLPHRLCAHSTNTIWRGNNMPLLFYYLGVRGTSSKSMRKLTHKNINSSFLKTHEYLFFWEKKKYFFYRNISYNVDAQVLRSIGTAARHARRVILRQL